MQEKAKANQNTKVRAASGLRKVIMRILYTARNIQNESACRLPSNTMPFPLALRVLQLNDYKIEVESEPGRGSKFTVIIPKR